LWWLLNWLGHKNVAVLDGGFPAWKNQGLEIDNQWPLPLNGQFSHNLNSNLVVTMRSLYDDDAFIVDSRDERRHRGEFEPIDPVAGHIPGSICIPYMNNTDVNGFWKPVDELQKNFAKILHAEPGPVFYCGSGVTACHNILAYRIATGKDARLYPGSWSEWIIYNKVES
jgi:thiosulfate/3-mercaptopyruvate sulfurtransferase